jgi:hypothetical protein
MGTTVLNEANDLVEMENPQEKLMDATKSIRYLTYQCINTVAADSDKIRLL